MEHVLVKVYGSLHPADEATLEALASVTEPGQVEREGDLLRVAFEGIWFPIEDFMDALRPHLTDKSEGRIDFIDMDAWRLRRHVIRGTVVEVKENSLNNVLDFSGH